MTARIFSARLALSSSSASGFFYMAWPDNLGLGLQLIGDELMQRHVRHPHVITSASQD
jgi:hypothetical protein